MKMNSLVKAIHFRSEDPGSGDQLSDAEKSFYPQWLSIYFTRALSDGTIETGVFPLLFRYLLPLIVSSLL
jgi:hypothetical protein